MKLSNRHGILGILSFALLFQFIYNCFSSGWLQTGQSAQTKKEHSHHHLLFSDPFHLWSRRDQVSKETVAAVLKAFAGDSSCYMKSLSTPENSLEQIALAIRKKFHNQTIAPGEKLVFSVIGDSVAADTEGFVDALQSFLTLSLNIPFPVEVRNIASGGKGPHYFATCNDLYGDEDIVLFENVRPGEVQGVLNLASSLVFRGYGVILYNWRFPLSWPSNDNSEFGFEEASNEFGLPLFTFPAEKEIIKECLPTNDAFSTQEDKLIYRDEVHPNPLGQIIIASMIGQLVEDATRIYKNSNLDWNKIEIKSRERVDNNDSHAKEILCFSQLNCSSPPEEGEEFGFNRCLDVKSANGFEKKSLPSGKVWWEGTQPGHSIDIRMPGTCTDINLFHNLRVTNGMVRVQVDGRVLEAPLENGILDGWYEGLWWLPKERGHNIITNIANDLPKRKHHIVRLTVLDKTNSTDGTYKFDITGIGCKN